MTIGNSPPSVTGGRITALDGSSIITSDDNLTVNYTFVDPDGDPENGTVFQWHASPDGSQWEFVFSGEILPETYTVRDEWWTCMIWPFDGGDQGDMYVTEPVFVQNTPPRVYNVSVGPESPTSSDGMFVRYDYADHDGDPESGTSFRWLYRDALGTHDSGYRDRTLPAAAVHRGQIWFCAVTPSDGSAVGTEVVSGEVAISNSPPVITSMDLSMDGSKRELLLDFDFADADGDDAASVSVVWYRNGERVPELEDLITVNGTFLARGDVWTAELMIHDGFDWSERVASREFPVPNSPPAIVGEVTLYTGREVLSNATLRPIYVHHDVDGDDVAGAEIRWFRDNGHMRELDDVPHIGPEHTRKGDMWRCEIRISDGEDWSPWHGSGTVLVLNSPPRYEHLEPGGTRVYSIETETVIFNVSGRDLDGDSIQYFWYLDGRIVLYEDDVSYSMYRMRTDYDSAGEYTLRIIMSDGEDTAEHTWNIVILDRNRLPVIEVIQPQGRNATMRVGEYLDFMISKHDPDGDEVDVRWYVDGTLVWETADRYRYDPQRHSVGERNITVEVYEVESGASTFRTWTVTVLDVEEDRIPGEDIIGRWWNVLEPLTFIGTVIIAIVGIYYFRRKKGKVLKTMSELEDIETSEDELPEKEKRVLALRESVTSEYSAGNLEEGQYLILDRRISDLLISIRKDMADGMAKDLPRDMKKELNSAMRDGVISEDEMKRLKKGIETMREDGVPEERIEKLQSTIERWSEESAEHSEPPPEPDEEEDGREME